MLARRALRPIVFTSATMARIGNASSRQPSKKKKPSMVRPPASQRSGDAIAMMEESEGPSCPSAETQTGCGPLGQHLATKTKQRRRPAAGRRRHVAGRLDQCGGLDQATEVLL